MSFNYNHVTLVGRLTKDAEVKDASNTVKTSFSLAIDRNYRKEDGSYDTDFIPIVAWGRLAEIAYQYLKKGNPVLVEGRLQIRHYEKTYNKETVKHWMSEIVVENFQMLGSKSNQEKTLHASESEPVLVSDAVS